MHHKLSLAITFFFVRFFSLFWLLKVRLVKAIMLVPKQFQGLHFFLRFFLVVHCSIFKIPQLLSVVIIHSSLWCFSLERQLIHYITLLIFCQVNKLWISSKPVELPLTYRLFSPFSLHFIYSLSPDSFIIIPHQPLYVKPFLSILCFA